MSYPINYYLDSFRALQIELKNVAEFSSAHSHARSPVKADIQEETETKDMLLGLMYEKLHLKYCEEVVRTKEENSKRLGYVEAEIKQINEKLAEIEQMKKEQQDPDIIKILEIKIQVFIKEQTKLKEFEEILVKFENPEDERSQLQFLKILQLFQIANRKYSQYITQKQCLEKLFTNLTDDLRRLKLRKQAKDQEDCEKKIQAIAADFSALETMPFFIDPITMIDYKFLCCSETDIYKNDIICLQKDIENCNIKIQLANQQIEVEEKGFQNYQIGIDQIQEEMLLHQKEHDKLLQKLSDAETKAKDILIWKEKYSQLSKLIKELQSSHVVKVQQLEQHLQIKSNEIKEMKIELQKKTIEFDEIKKNQGEVEIDSKTKGLQDEIHRLKQGNLYSNLNSQLEINITKIQSIIQKRKEEVDQEKSQIQQAQNKLTQLKMAEQQIMSQLAASESTQNELDKFQDKQRKKVDKQARLQIKVQEKLKETSNLKDKIQEIGENIQSLKQQVEKTKLQSNKKDKEIKNIKLRLDLNVK